MKRFLIAALFIAGCSSGEASKGEDFGFLDSVLGIEPSVASSSPCCSCACVDDGDDDGVGELWRCAQLVLPDPAAHCGEFFNLRGELVVCGGGAPVGPPPDACFCLNDVCTEESAEACAARAARACFNDPGGQSAVPCDEDGIPGPDPCEFRR